METEKKKRKKLTPVEIVFWSISLTILLGVAVFWLTALNNSSRYCGSDRAGCILNQRNIQQAVRSYANMHNLKPGDPIDWSDLVGPGKFLETLPECPLHGKTAYQYSPVVPEIGTLAAPCRDPEHRPTDIEGW